MDCMTAPVPEPPAGLLETVELTRRLRETEAELARVTLRLRRLESSGTVQLAQLLVAAVRNPRKGLVDLPRGSAVLVRRWWARRAGRLRPGVSSPAGAGRRGGAAPSPGPKDGRPQPGRAAQGGEEDPGAPAGARLADRLLAASAVLVTTRDRPVLAVVADPASAQRWSEQAHVQRLRPDDAVAVFAAVMPDVLVVHPAAGRSGAWSGLGTYAVPERDRTVLELLRAARDRGVPAVLVPPVTREEAPMLTDARPLFSGEAPPDAGVDELLAAGRVPA
jgi:hypothetical protein